MTTTLIIPGLNSSGPAHWQSWLEDHIPGTLRVIQSDFSKPDLAAWAQRLRRDITRTPGKLVLVAHSFGALAAAQAATDHADRIAGALLVAPADPDRFGVAELLPQHALPFPAVVVASTNDPWMSLERAAHWADTWGADFVNLGAAGHINVDSGFGPWPEGLALWQRLIRGVPLRAPSLSRRVRRLEHRRAQPLILHRRREAHTRDDAPIEQHAANLLRARGWQVEPPSLGAPVIRSVRQ